jgi:branched-chain amino acid transport system permease protein
VRIQRSQFKAWVLSAAVAGGMGACYAGLLGAFSPKDFYFTLTLTLLTMLIVGGSGSVAGAVVGVVLVMAVIENLRKIGDSIGLFGLTNAGLAIHYFIDSVSEAKGNYGLP